MRCVICGKKAKYNEKLNIYYCDVHGFTTWVENEELIMEVKKDAQTVLG